MKKFLKIFLLITTIFLLEAKFRQIDRNRYEKNLPKISCKPIKNINPCKKLLSPVPKERKGRTIVNPNIL